MRAFIYERPREIDDSDFADYLDPSSTAVISIDLHRGHLEDSPDCPCPAPRARQLIAPVDAFHAQARAAGVRIVHVRSVLRADGSDDLGGIPSAWRRTFPLHVGDIPNHAAHALEGSRWTEWLTQVEPCDLMVSNKRRLSAFYPTDLDFLLRNQRIDTLVFNGGFADCCVLNSAFEAANLNYRVIVLRDLVRGTDEHLESAAFSMVSLHLGLVMESAELLATWTQRQAGVVNNSLELR